MEIIYCLGLILSVLTVAFLLEAGKKDSVSWFRVYFMSILFVLLWPIGFGAAIIYALANHE